MSKKAWKLLFWNFLLACFIVVGTGQLFLTGPKRIVSSSAVFSTEYREQKLNKQLCEFLRTKNNPGKYVGLYLLENDYGYEGAKSGYDTDTFFVWEKKWSKSQGWSDYLKVTESVWNDVKYFPVPEFPNSDELDVSYVNTWMSERTYGGTRGHEGTDIMAGKNERGLYPIISMTDGIITKKGWLEQGGYRIGVTAPGGAYFYYAHLDSYADVDIGDTVKAGDILGYMGDSGYGEEGTVGQFAVHLHLGIYVSSNGREVSVNPYWVLRYIENRKVKCYN